MMRRIPFLSGLLLGSVLCAWLLGAALIYFLTGKVVSLYTGPDGTRLRLHDLSLHEIIAAEEA